jgi:uncharacterized protein
MEGISPLEILAIQDLTLLKFGLGIEFGVFYAFIALIFMRSRVFEGLPHRMEKLIKSMRLNFFDCMFLSLCAGIGEEFLFRSGVQFYLGPLLTSFLFVALHGYFSFRNWKVSLYGLIVFPFILLISLGLSEFGIWFCIAAHFAYDLVLFLAITRSPINDE